MWCASRHFVHSLCSHLFTPHTATPLHAGVVEKICGVTSSPVMVSMSSSTIHPLSDTSASLPHTTDSVVQDSQAIEEGEQLPLCWLYSKYAHTINNSFTSCVLLSQCAYKERNQHIFVGKGILRFSIDALSRTKCCKWLSSCKVYAHNDQRMRSTRREVVVYTTNKTNKQKKS